MKDYLSATPGFVGSSQVSRDLSNLSCSSVYLSVSLSRSVSNCLLVRPPARPPTESSWHDHPCAPGRDYLGTAELEEIILPFPTTPHFCVNCHFPTPTPCLRQAKGEGERESVERFGRIPFLPEPIRPRRLASDTRTDAQIRSNGLF